MTQNWEEIKKQMLKKNPENDIYIRNIFWQYSTKSTWKNTEFFVGYPHILQIVLANQISICI